MMFHSNGPKSMKNVSRTLKTELVKKLYLLYPILSTHSIFVLTHPALVLDPSWYKSFQFQSGKRIVSFNSRVFTKDEKKMSTLHGELCEIISTLQTYERFIIGSPHPIKLFRDHKPLLYLWARKGRLSHHFFRYQVTITQLTNLQIIWTPGKNLAFPDLLSRIVSLKDRNGHQLAHKEISKDISFFIRSGHEVQYLIDQKSFADDGNDSFYPIVCTHMGETKTLHLKNDDT